MVILCSVAVGYVSRGSSSSAPVTSREVVTHDYVYRVEEHLKGCLSKLTDWSVAEINQQRKRTGEQEKKLEQLLERVVEQEKKSAGGETHAEQSVMLQCLDQRLASLERILAEAVSSGVKAGVSCSATPLLVQEKPTVEPSEKSDSESGSVSGAETVTAGIEVVTPMDPSNQNESDEGWILCSNSGKKKKPAGASVEGTGDCPLAYALLSELHPAPRVKPAQRGGGGLDSDCLFCHMVEGLKSRAQGVHPA